MKRKILLVVLFFLGVPLAPYGLTATIYVNSGQSIQQAINAAQNGDTIVVYAGVYSETINFKGKQITVTSAQGPSATIIDGNGISTVITFNSGEDRRTLLEGFTIRNGRGQKLDDFDYGFGGGILCRGSSPTIRGNIIEQNKADPATTGNFGLGGGICVYEGAYPYITNNTIRNNSAESGAGIYIFTTNDPEQTNSIQTYIENNSITSNSAQLGGAIFICGNSHPKIINNTVSDNTQLAGSQIYICSDSSAEIVNPTTTTTTTTEPTLITVRYFKAAARDRTVIVSWATESEFSNAGFNIYRAESEGGPYIKINDALICAKGSATQGEEYEFVDKNVRLWKTYYYKLEDIDVNGVATFHGPVSATVKLLK
ncbi:MAG: right-handed parallel beta-helix repeat-containing protein [Desulfobacterota bacterium]|nr:right-handed parallel beta-helix repeat-containing protein [Thermodesulfobacteriota bacterium]